MENERDISLHGSGFAQIKLPGGLRMHVWHPDFPVKKNHLNCEFHDHRFEFTSRILVGVIENNNYNLISTPDALTSVAPNLIRKRFSHEGERNASGGRPWKPSGFCRLELKSSLSYVVGHSYYMPPFIQHRSRCISLTGMAAALMRKGRDFAGHASSVGNVDFRYETFDRFQMTDDEIMKRVNQVFNLGDSA